MMNESEIGQDTPNKLSSDNTEPRGAWIRYRTEIYDRETDETIHFHDSTEPKPVELEQSDNGPAFEFVSRYGARRYDAEPGKSQAPKSMPSPVVGSAPSYLLRIFSLAIINALQSVVAYYPEQDLSGPRVVIEWPYAVLVHHYANLRDFKAMCDIKDPAELCVREKDASEHIDLLLRFLDDNIMEHVRTEEKRLERGYFTFENLWVACKPGRTVVFRGLTGEQMRVPFVISELCGGIFESPTTWWVVQGWRLEFTGELLQRVRTERFIDRFDGETKLKDRMYFVDDIDKVDDDELNELILDGEKYWKLLKKQCRYHNGKCVDFPYNQIDGLVMADLETYIASIRRSDSSMPPWSYMGFGDCQSWASDCACDVCKQRASYGRRNVASVFDAYLDVAVEDGKELTRHMYLLCPKNMPAFVFKLRKWEKLHVANFKAPEFERDMIDTLVMDPGRVRALKALASSYIRINQHGKPIEHEAWAADFVKGKGSGLIFLLHGKPGVGKTATAESIAEFTQRPLMSLTSSDIGTDPLSVEKNLTRDFKTARSWDAVLLIDEADVFMERRSSHDLTRNSLVAGFLRALEFYDGILFLTTNRVGAFDDAFISRIHIQLFYRDFTDEERQKVWLTFVHKLNKDRGKFMRISLDAKDYLKGKELQDVKWNGREIRNAFQTAVSLAEYEDERDEEGKILLTDEHLRSVVALSKDFKNYLDELHKADEDKRAQRRFDR